MWITCKHQGPLVCEYPSFAEPEQGQWIEDDRNHYSLIQSDLISKEQVIANLLQQLQSWTIISQWRCSQSGVLSEQEPKIALDGGQAWMPQRAREVCKAVQVEAGTYLLLLTGSFRADLIDPIVLQVGLGIGEPALLPSDPIARTSLTLGPLPSNCSLSQIVTLKHQQAVYAQIRLQLKEPISGVIVEAPQLGLQILKID